MKHIEPESVPRQKADSDPQKEKKEKAIAVSFNPFSAPVVFSSSEEVNLTLFFVLPKEKKKPIYSYISIIFE